MTLEILWTVACQALLSMRFPRQKYWSGLPFSSPEDLPHPGIKPRFPALQADSLPTELGGKPLDKCSIYEIKNISRNVTPKMFIAPLIGVEVRGVWESHTPKCQAIKKYILVYP